MDSNYFFPIEGINTAMPDNFVMADTVPNYLLTPSPGYGVLSTPSYVTAPETSGGFLGGVSDFFTNTVPSGVKNVTNSIGSWFSSPSNSNGSTVQAAATGAVLLNTVASFFKGTNTQSNKANTTQQPVGLGVVGALKALAGIGKPPAGQQSITEAAGSGLGNIVGGATKPLIPVLVLIVVGLLATFLVLGRIQRSA